MKIRIKVKYVLSFFVFLGLLLLGFTSCSQFGTLPSGKDLERVRQSTNYNQEKKEFVNRLPNIMESMKKRVETWAVTREFFFGSDSFRKPKEKLPEITPNLKDFLKKSDHLKVIWLGTQPYY